MKKPRFTDPIELMTLGNMRANGVRSLAVSCHLCHHETIISAARWADEVSVPVFGPRMVCTSCGIVGAKTTCTDARPHGRGKAAGCHGFHPPARYGFHFTGVTASGVPLLELIQPDAVSLHGLGSL
jgi:hypothetical protein